ncbi:MAG: DEAD/DEAH box helicase [Gordonia amarae]
MGSVHEVIEAFRKAPSNSERGTLFEKLMVRYFQLDPMLSQQYDQVWRWTDWPGRAGKPDTGIDLVARTADTGELTAIQCKFYEPAHTLAKSDIDSFFTASGKTPFTNRIIISTTDKWSSNAEASLDGQTIPVQRIGLADIAESPIDWDLANPDTLHVELSEAKRHDPRPHQQAAIDAVFDHYGQGHDRGQLIMACGTGKTFTALKVAERTADENGGTARILFCVPSISLLSQTLREWTAQTRHDLRAFGVCSDRKVSRAAEDVAVHDVAIPVTTDAATLVAEMEHRKRAKGLTVVFTTYQSLPAIAAAQKAGVDPFDLIICDEAHRTTGVTLAGEDASNFVLVHDNTVIRGARRLYMTATPRLYSNDTKDQAAEHSAELASMDDETKFGPVFHRLTFGEAVDNFLLTDYKVLVLTVDESVMSGRLQSELAGEYGELNLDDASKIIGCWNGLAKRSGTTPAGEQGFAVGEAPMRRAVAFARDIADSKHIAEVFPAVVDSYRDLLTTDEDDGHRIDDTNRDLSCAIRHVDGTFNALQRNEALAWLKAPIPDSECRVLTNARCLSEGVDVPALDAVLFLQPRNSIVDVVQSVGRVMRRADGKDYGYIILPVAVPAGTSPAAALADNKRFKVVWQVLNALRAHDDRFNAMVNAIALNNTSDQKTGKGSSKLLGAHLGPTTDPDDTLTDNPDASDNTRDGTDSQGVAQQMALFALSDWQEAIFTRIVDKVGTRVYWEQWAEDVAGIAGRLIERITATLTRADTTLTEAFDAFVQGLRDNLNDSITNDDAISMLAQHLITKPVFDALFAGHDFASHNPVSRVMQTMIDSLGAAGLEAETRDLQGFYNSVALRAAQVTSAEGKQQVIAELYEKFFRIGFKKQADALGIVYTPIQVVDWILHAADTVSRQHFGRGLTDENVHVLDPFTGTGTFLTRLMQTGLIHPDDLSRKYTSELHANELMLLAYYVAAVNIESTYHPLAGRTGADEYEPFPGIVLADTFQIHEADDTIDTRIFLGNNERAARQLETKIDVIVGNPPYSVGQGSANDLNINMTYPTTDSRIANTYAKRSTATSQRTLYDSYIRAFRWATDRIGDQGIVAFVSNGGWIDGNTADGMRLTLADDYSHIHIYNLRGNQRTAGELSRKEGGKIFGGGSRNTVAIFIGVKTPGHNGPATIAYHDIGDYLSRDDKLRILDTAPLTAIDWTPITPNAAGDWINQRDDAFNEWSAIGDKSSTPTVFAKYSLGLATGRDAWCSNYSRSAIKSNVGRMIEFYNSQVAEFDSYCGENGISDRKKAVDNFINTDPTKISWNSSSKQSLTRGVRFTFSADAIHVGAYRPFQRQNIYFHQHLNERRYQLPTIFPTPHHNNVGILLTAPASHFEFTPFITNLLPNLHLLDTGQFFPRYTYELVDSSAAGELDFDADTTDVDEYGYRRVDNITDDILTRYRTDLGDSVTKDQIFWSVYGQLHVPEYRQRYAADLKKMLPRIPTPESLDRFTQLAEAGERLGQLHINYDDVDPYPLEVAVKPTADPADRDTWRVQKMKWRSKTDHTTIVYSPKVTISGIPAEAEEYMLGSRSALGWIIDRYQVKTDKASGIVNDPNLWCDWQVPDSRSRLF